MPLSVRILVACASALVLAGCGGGARMIVGAKVPLAPPGAYVSDDVGAGYAAYKDVLARWGEWSPDESYGVHWCPRPGAAFPAAAPFQPYRERGHWDAREDAPTKYGVPPGSPFWVSDDSDTWGEITMHHGWWVQVPDDNGTLSQISPWCWVPGLDETPARVVWRSGGGFVGWAPEPPSWIDDGDEGLYAYFEWTFVMVGGLLEDDLDDQCLDGDAQAVAANATSRNPVVQVFDPTSGKWGEEKKKSASLQRFARIGPNVREVHDAKKALVAYAQSHPEIRETAPAQASAPSSSPSSSSSASSTSSTSSKKKTAEADELPRAMAMYPIMLREPMVGPLGLTPRFLRMPDPFVDQTKAAVSTSSSPSNGGPSSSHATSWQAHTPSPTPGYSGSPYSTGSSAPITSTHTSSSSSNSTSSTHSYSSSSHTSGSSSSSSSSHTAVHHK